MKWKTTLLWTILIIVPCSISAQEIDIDSLKNVIKNELREELKEEKEQQISIDSKSKNRLFQWSKFNLRGYGAINYHSYDYDTDKNLRDKIDVERLNLYLDYHFTDKIKLNSEIEFEHGGVGSTMELDYQEEFGEYEVEIEKGGGVKLEQLNVQFDVKPYLNFKLGRFKLHFNSAQSLDSPDKYFTTHRQEMESELVPLGWYETGIEAFGTFLKDKMSYRLAFVNGLDATGFSSRNWI